MVHDARDFRIVYGKEAEELVGPLLDALKGNLARILAFFGLERLSKPRDVVLYGSLDAYRKHLAPYVDKVEDWMIADTFDENIHILTLDACRRTQAHRDMEFEEYLPVIVHELVHACQQELNPDSEGCEWFWEALATNLSGQRMREVPITCTAEQLAKDFMRLPNGYPMAYTLGKNVLENLPHEQVLRYAAEPETLKREAAAILRMVQQE